MSEALVERFCQRNGLWHYPVYRATFNLGLRGFTFFIAGSLVTFMVAVCSYYFLERPMLRLKKRFTNVTSHKSASGLEPHPMGLACGVRRGALDELAPGIENLGRQ